MNICINDNLEPGVGAPQFLDHDIVIEFYHNHAHNLAIHVVFKKETYYAA